MSFDETAIEKLKQLAKDGNCVGMPCNECPLMRVDTVCGFTYVRISRAKEMLLSLKMGKVLNDL